MIQNIYKMREVPPLFNVTNIISMFYLTFAKHHSVKGEIHNFWELVYVEDGFIGVTAHNQILELEAGQIIFHKPGEFHNLWSAKDSTPKVFIFTFTLDSPLLELEHMKCTLSDLECSLLNLLISECQVFETLVDDTTTLMSLHCCDESSYGLNHIIKNYLELLLLFIIKNHYKTDISLPPLTISHSHFQKIVAYIHANLFYKINIDMICENCSISHTSLKNLFRKYVGMSAMEYVNHLKIQASIGLLSKGLSHQEIADMLGFSSPYYFSTVFKRIMGASPKHYKKFTQQKSSS